MTTLRPTHKAIRAYYDQRDQATAFAINNEQGTREAFKHLLHSLAPTFNWRFFAEQPVKLPAGIVRPDGVLREEGYLLDRGHWEAKDTADNLDAEIDKKIARGYPLDNIIFEDTRRAVLYQGGKRAGEFDLTQPADLADLLTRFFTYAAPVIATFHAAVEKFREDTPRHAARLNDLIASAHRDNRAFKQAFADFFELCKTALNPNISQAAVDEMLIQHMLTERLMTTVFDMPQFVQRNVIAAEIEKVILALMSQSFSQSDFLGDLDYFYRAIEDSARTITDFKEKQTFINTVYERFFQGYAVKVADTHGIVYTPQPIVDFMCAAVEEVLHNEFGLALHDENVAIIDPCTGTGNFIINLLHRIHRQNPAMLAETYAERLFANEVMLLPYYIASLNIEHTYYELAGRYAPFEGLCFVDTLDLAQTAQRDFFHLTEKNAERVERQKAAPITVVIGNPPYNVGQLNENDNNKNREYGLINRRVRESYAKATAATLKMQLYDPYVKFFRWATDRLQGRDGIVCFVSNNSFVDGVAFDAMRRELLKDFTRVYHLDLHGNVRQNPKLSGTTHNVFGIQVGVGVTVAVRSQHHSDSRLYFYRVPENWTATEKLDFLDHHVEVHGRENSLESIEWSQLIPDEKNNWLVPENADEYERYLPVGSKDAKSAKGVREPQAVFKTYSGGIKSNRDTVIYDFDDTNLATRMRRFIEDYNGEVDRYRRAGMPEKVDDFVKYDLLKWDGTLKGHLQNLRYSDFRSDGIRCTLYRPYTRRYLYFDRLLINSVYQNYRIFPTPATEIENRVIVISDIGHRAPQFSCLMTNMIAELHLAASSDGHQCFPFYTYDEDGSNRRENITDWALAQFRAHYGDDTISKWDIFYYVYALLHHPQYRARFAANLKKELPRIPYAIDFRAYARTGEVLAALHVDYETVTPYPLGMEWTAGKHVHYRVDKMRLDSKDRTRLKVNDALTLTGIPPQVFDYRLGNRSALDWVIDQYQVKTDARSGITSDPNRYSDDEQYIVKLVQRVVTVSVETVKLVDALPELFGDA